MYKAILKIAYPIGVSRLLNVLLDVIAVFVVARIGITYLAAYGLSMPLYVTIYMILISYLLIFSVKAAHLHEHPSRFSSYFFTGLIFSVGLSVIAIILFSVMPTILSLLGQSANLVDMSGGFFYYITLGMPALFVSSIISQSLIIRSHSTLVSVCAFIQFIIGLASIYLLTNYYHYGLIGVALGFDIAYWFKFLFLGCFFIKSKQVSFSQPVIFRRKFSEDMHFLLRIGWPISVQYGGELIAGSIATLMIGHLYAHALAAQQVAAQLRVFLLMVPYSLSQASAILIAKYQKNAEGNLKHEIKKLFKHAVIMGSCVIFLVLLVVNIFSAKYVSLFIGENHPDLQLLAQYFVLITSFALLVECVKYVLMGLLRGLHNTKTSMLLSLFFYWVIGIPLAYFLGYKFGFGAVGVRIGLLVGLIISAIAIYMYYLFFIDNYTQRT